MKTIKTLSLAVLVMTAFVFAYTPKTDKKVKNFKISQTFDIPASKIWAIVGEDYGAIANSHPKIVESHYINGSLKAQEGAERVCNFNAEGTQFLKEKMVDYDPKNMRFINTVYQAGKFPVDPDYTYAIYKVDDLGNGKSRLSFDMTYRTKPSYMGGFMKRSFKGLIGDYFIAIEHHAKTGEKVNATNFKAIKKQYKKNKKCKGTCKE